MKIVKKIYLLQFLFILLLPAVSYGHPFYVSICQVDFNAKNHTLEISVKIFADDLTKTLAAKNIPDLHFGEASENPKSDSYIFDYLKDNLAFRVNDKDVNYSYVGKEMEDDAIWCFLEISGIQNITKIEVTDRILTETFPDQNNIVQVNNGDKILNLLLNKRKIKGDLSFR